MGEVNLRTNKPYEVVCPHCRATFSVSVKLKPRKKRAKVFKAPTLQECKDYAEEKALHINPEQFFNYYNESEWTDNQGLRVKNWKLKMQTWHTRNYNKERAYTGRRVGTSRRKRKGEE